ncbi:hypothetical protein [Streptomyces sp. NEAU-S7GS2]|uniref:hypothetical protein n=1 Tax=Streptomyces sp. NEAU-S7GS2 TaxID=2202000 RepID=UPI001EF50A3D|nr:hypothetical protein [Streptomyces sp. NEAU-S7GS2]
MNSIRGAPPSADGTDRIIQLATATREALGDRVDIRVVDGGISNTQTVQQAVRAFAPDLVGISALTPTTPRP